jgi:Rieske Fe-S protein
VGDEALPGRWRAGAPGKQNSTAALRVARSRWAGPPPPSNPDQIHLWRRRRLLRAGFWAGAATLAAGAVAAAADFINPPLSQVVLPGIVWIPAAQVPPPCAALYQPLHAKFWLVNLEPGEGAPPPVGPRPGLLGSGSRSGGLLALSSRCPARGCAVIWRPDRAFTGVTGWLNCPCCGSLFTKAGLYGFGPAGRSLDTFSIASVTRHGISIDTRRALLGDTSDPQRAVPAGPFA